MTNYKRYEAQVSVGRRLLSWTMGTGARLSSLITMLRITAPFPCVGNYLLNTKRKVYETLLDRYGMRITENIRNHQKYVCSHPSQGWDNVESIRFLAVHEVVR